MDCVKDFGGVNIDEANEFIYDLERLRVEGVGGGDSSGCNIVHGS